MLKKNLSAGHSGNVAEGSSSLEYKQKSPVKQGVKDVLDNIRWVNGGAASTE